MSRVSIELTGLTVYPVKSMKGIELERATLTPLGLEHDRQFMVVRANGSFVTQRDLPRMALVSAGLEAGGLVLSREGYGRIFVPFDKKDGKYIRTRVWKDECKTTDQGKAVSNWLTKALESDERLHLVAMAPGYVRPQGKPDKLGSETQTLFADAAPFLVASEDSLTQLNRELVLRGHEPVPMSRFRPNIVVNGLTAFSEHSAGRLLGENCAFRLCYPCQRCVVTTIDQLTATRNPDWEPYRTLCDINPMPGGKKAPAFGQNAILENGAGATIRTGDRLSMTGT